MSDVVMTTKFSCAEQIDAIREYWGYCGEIEDLDVMRFPDTGRFKGIAFITYATVSLLPPLPACQLCSAMLQLGYSKL